MIITLSAPYTTQPKVEVSTVTVLRLVDFPGEKVVRAVLSEIPNAIVLWEGDAYDAAGQWTDADVQKRLIELLS